MRGVSESMMKRKYCHPILQERGLSCGFPEIEDGVGQKKVPTRGHALEEVQVSGEKLKYNLCDVRDSRGVGLMPTKWKGQSRSIGMFLVRILPPQ